jgi:hypothetical protein
VAARLSDSFADGESVRRRGKGRFAHPERGCPTPATQRRL